MGKTLFTFTDDMFPVRELIEKTLSEAGYELDEKYSGTSYNPALAYTFNYLISNGKVDFLETMAVEVDEHEPNIELKALVQRYSFTPRIEGLLHRIMRGTSMFDAGGESFTTVQHNRDLAYTVGFVCATSVDFGHANSDTKVLYEFFQQYWQEQHKVTSLAPFAFVENFGNIAQELEKRKLYLNYRCGTEYQGRSINRDGVDQLKDTVAVAFLFDSSMVLKLVMQGLRAYDIMAYVNSGVESFKDILEWSENMPLEWASILLESR